MGQQLSPEILELLKKAVKEDLDNFSVMLQDPNKKGEGVLGEMCFVSLKNKRNGLLYYVVVKQAFVNEEYRREYLIRSHFLNEIFFYSRIWPCMLEFQKEKLGKIVFDKVAKCYATSVEENNEKIVLENLRYENFVGFQKCKPFDEEHIEFAFKQYGIFHGVSFAYKEAHPKKFKELEDGLSSKLAKLCDINFFCNFLPTVLKHIMNDIEASQDAKVVEKFRPYAEDGLELFRNACNGKANYPCLLHGDCWSNNMMFKYDEGGRLTDIKMIDFQFVYTGSPVSDLSYFLYSGGTKELYDKLDYYLRLYHNSLSDTLKGFGYSADRIYPFEELEEDWKRYSKIGLCMGLLLWRMKLRSESSAVDFVDLDTSSQSVTDFLATDYDVAGFKKVYSDLILHMYQNDFL